MMTRAKRDESATTRWYVRIDKTPGPCTAQLQFLEARMVYENYNETFFLFRVNQRERSFYQN